MHEFDEKGDPELITIKKDMMANNVLIIEVGKDWKHEEANLFIKPHLMRISKALEQAIENNKTIIFFNIDKNCKPSPGQVIEVARFFSEIKYQILENVWCSILIIRNQSMNSLLDIGLQVVKPQRPLHIVSSNDEAFKKIIEEKNIRDK